MKKPISPTPGHSVNALSRLTGHDRRTLDKVVVKLKPCGKVNGKPVYRLEDVHAALAAKPDKSLREEKLFEEIRQLKLKNDARAGLLVPKADVAASIRSALGQVSQICEAKLVNEYPIAVAGLAVAEARLYGRRLHDSIMMECSKLSKLFPE